MLTIALLVALVTYGSSSAATNASTIDHHDVLLTLVPCEIMWDSVVRSALQILRKSKHEDVDSLVSLALHPCMHDDGKNNRHLTLTLVGDKGGSPLEQTNQDRGFIHSARFTRPTDDVLLAGVSDGHGALGHYASEWTSNRLKQSVFQALENDKQPLTKEVIIDIVRKLDKTIPSVVGSNSGATLSFIVKQGDSIYFSNTGDSQSFLAAVVLDGDNELKNVEVVFASALHKPNSTSERSRLDSLGYIVDDEDNRVWYPGEDGSQYGMATSRTIGDHNAGQALIPDPDVTEFSVSKLLYELAKGTQGECVEVQADGSTDSSSCQDATTTPFDRTHLFAVSATDGILDYIEPEAIAYQLAQALYEGNKRLVTTVEDIIHQASAHWHEEMHGEYRDDITITVCHIY